MRRISWLTRPSHSARPRLPPNNSASRWLFGSFDQGFYLLQNNQFNSMTIFTAEPATPVAKVSVDIYPSGSGAYSGGGLVFNFDTVKGDWLGVTLQPDGNVGVWVYGGSSNPEKVTQLPGQGLRTDVVTRLSLENSEAGVDFLTNGQKSGSFSDRKLLGAYIEHIWMTPEAWADMGSKVPFHAA